jgi:hypothetical protein
MFEHTMGSETKAGVVSIRWSKILTQDVIDIACYIMAVGTCLISVWIGKLIPYRYSFVFVMKYSR